MTAPVVTPAQIAAAWRAFRGDRPGTLLGPGPGFREAIEAAFAVAEDGWRSSETAPKNGTDILVWCVSRGDEWDDEAKMEVAYWHKDAADFVVTESWYRVRVIKWQPLPPEPRKAITSS